MLEENTFYKPLGVKLEALSTTPHIEWGKVTI